MVSQDVFVPVGTGPIPAAITSRNDHPVRKIGVVSAPVNIHVVALTRLEFFGPH